MSEVRDGREAGNRCDYEWIAKGRSLWGWNSSVSWLPTWLQESTHDKVTVLHTHTDTHTLYQHQFPGVGIVLELYNM